ncbi:S-adenosyl-L-methionine-dependent methyltransferase [Thelonectria olida]|uniref:S-adenosyl-L-methionine-dependent methyltransferase n=1 Tax=Thelonectria olida TaxID=1576542 RepID=A0A9P8W998_9HYPO|nr:S-adenosyl-L-methionine-dependent methyltransferase [Thelonectria olida]
MSSPQANGSSKATPIIEANPALQKYYESQESYIVYEVILRGTHHFGYYAKDTYWPFPIGPSLKRMEAKLLSTLALPAGSQLLDAGCGFGHVGLYMAKKGMRVNAIDIIDHHVEKARRNVELAKLPKGQVTVERMDYQRLESIASESHDGVYTLQAMGHATDPKRAVDGFFRIVRPGGRIALIEAQRRRSPNEEDGDDELSRHLRLVNDYTAMPTNEASYEDYFKTLLQEAGFVDVEVEDMSENIRPQLRLFYSLVLVPWFFIRLLGLEKHFTNMICATSGYEGQPRWRFVAVSATKPGPGIEAPKTK